MELCWRDPRLGGLLELVATTDMFTSSVMLEAASFWLGYQQPKLLIVVL